MIKEVREKLCEMIHYVCSISEKGVYSRTRLIKVLWFSDTSYFNERGISISGLECYKKYSHGAFIEQIYDIEKELKKSNILSIKKIKHANDNEGIHYKSIKEYKKEKLSSKQLNILKQSMDMLEPYNSSEISDISHEDWWEYYEEGEDIPVSIRAITKSKKVDKSIIEKIIS